MEGDKESVRERANHSEEGVMNLIGKCVSWGNGRSFYRQKCSREWES